MSSERQAANMSLLRSSCALTFKSAFERVFVRRKQSLRADEIDEIQVVAFDSCSRFRMNIWVQPSHSELLPEAGSHRNSF